MHQKPVILHVARTPLSGVWALMRNLAVWQAQNDQAVMMRVIADKSWPGANYEELASLPIDANGVRFPWLGAGTINFLSHLFLNPVRTWIAEAQQKHRASRVIVHFHDGWRSGAYLPCEPNKQVSIRSVATFHGVGAGPTLRKQPVRRRIHAWLGKRLLRNDCRLVSVDPTAVEVAHELFGLPQKAFSVIPNGVAQVPPLRALQRAERPFTVGFVSLLYRDKGWHLAAEAVRSLAEKGANVQLWIAGSGPEQAEAEAWCRKHAHFARFFGFVQDAGRTFVPKLDALVLPSTHEGVPMVLLEALAAGVPVLATAVGGIVSIIDDESNGFFVTRNGADISAKLQRLIEHPDLHLAMKKHALEKYHEHYSVEACGRRYEALYAELFDGSQAKADSLAESVRVPLSKP